MYNKVNIYTDKNNILHNILNNNLLEYHIFYMIYHNLCIEICLNIYLHDKKYIYNYYHISLYIPCMEDIYLYLKNNLKCNRCILWLCLNKIYNYYHILDMYYYLFRKNNHFDIYHIYKCLFHNSNREE